jgi:hypothetical protein
MGASHILTSIITTVLTCTACGHHPPPPYAIRDLPAALQLPATRAVNTGIVGYDTATRYIRTKATDSEISLLSQAENPILRAIGLDEMTHRPHFNHNKVLMANLDDTAGIFEDVGEIWVQPAATTVIDYIINRGRWKSTAARDTLAKEVILHHDNLSSGYEALYFLPPLPEYHDHITKMIVRDRDYNREIEYALTALAKYKRREDIPLIKDIFLTCESRLGRASFSLMTDYPDTAYLEVLEKYYPRRFYRAICRDQQTDAARKYIQTLATYKTDTCAKILSAILNRKPMTPCLADTLALREDVMNAIWNNPCPAYVSLRTRIAPAVFRQHRQDSIWNLGLDTSYHPMVIIDTSAEPVRWW